MQFFLCVCLIINGRQDLSTLHEGVHDARGRQNRAEPATRINPFPTHTHIASRVRAYGQSHQLAKTFTL